MKKTIFFFVGLLLASEPLFSKKMNISSNYDALCFIIGALVLAIVTISKQRFMGYDLYNTEGFPEVEELIFVFKGGEKETLSNPLATNIWKRFLPHRMRHHLIQEAQKVKTSKEKGFRTTAV